MSAVEQVYSMVHNRDPELYPRTSSLAKAPELEMYFSKVAKFRNVDALYREESYFHVTERGTVQEVREEMGLQDGYRLTPETPLAPESGGDYAWHNGSLDRDDPAGQQRLCVSTVRHLTPEYLKEQS